MTLNITVDNTRVNYDKNPDICPVCHHAVEPKVRGASISGSHGDVHAFLDIALQCTQGRCRRMFIGRYKRSVSQNGKVTSDFKLKAAVPLTYSEPELFEEVVEISPAFSEIYKQAAAAESYELDEIAGVGYRKALEFLMKDYCVHKKPDEEDDIKKSMLAKVIRNHVDDANVKMCAERATWLGNDETHYVRKWDDKDINDLKILIDLTCGWVRNNVLTEKYIAQMER